MRRERRLRCAVWEFTLACNLRCSHCVSSAGTARGGELDVRECYSLCEQLADLHCEDVTLMGGEPFLRNDCYSVARCAQQLGMRVSFVSNGTVLDGLMDDLVRIGPRVVGISLDGMRESHERIRGPGTWEKAKSAILRLLGAGIPVTVITTVSKINFRDLPEMKDLLLGTGANWQIQVAMPFGNFRREDMLSKEEFYATALFISKARVTNEFDDLPVVGAHCYGYFSKVLPGCRWDGCQAGISVLGITSDGGVTGCLSLGNDRFIEGNVRQRSLREIWDDPRSFAYNRVPEQLLPGENCQGCVNEPRCGGGCSSVSYSLTGKFHNDPYCFHAIEKELRL